MKFKEFYIKHKMLFQVLDTVLGTSIMFYAMYFSDKPASVNTIKENINNPMMYLCILISFLGSLWISKSISNKMIKK